MSQAHPMIQPASWGNEDHPDQVAKNLPTDRANIYRIIWHSSLACVMRPPLLRHERMVWSTPAGVSVAAAAVQVIAGQEGYYLERQDYPATSWQLNDSLALHVDYGNYTACSDYRLIGYSLRRPRGLSPGAMIQGIFDAGISTPASTASLIRTLLGKNLEQTDDTGGLQPTAMVKIAMQDKPNKQGKQGNHAEVHLTEEATKRLAIWKAAGMVGWVQHRNALVAAVEQDALSPRDALQQLIDAPISPISPISPDSDGSHSSPGSANLPGSRSQLEPMAALVARQIDAMCRQWQGMSRDDAMREQAKLAFKPPLLHSLPAWIDPEVNLPGDHPLRAWRERMEADLALANTAWSVTDAAKRAQARLAWLRAHALQITDEGGGNELLSAMNPQTGRYSTLRYWLTGMEAETKNAMEVGIKSGGKAGRSGKAS